WVDRLQDAVCQRVHRRVHDAEEQLFLARVVVVERSRLPSEGRGYGAHRRGVVAALPENSAGDARDIRLTDVARARLRHGFHEAMPSSRAMNSSVDRSPLLMVRAPSAATAAARRITRRARWCR